MKKYISSDTNIWFDFMSISRINLPFKLPYTYIMYYEAMRTEIVEPPELLYELNELGVLKIEISLEEFIYAGNLSAKYKKLSTYDRIALAIAKIRNITLLTGDNELRKAAIIEKVEVIGTIGILDRLYLGGYIDKPEYRYCLESFLNNSERRLPKAEIEERLHDL